MAGPSPCTTRATTRAPTATSLTNSPISCLTTTSGKSSNRRPHLLHLQPRTRRRSHLARGLPPLSPRTADREAYAGDEAETIAAEYQVSPPWPDSGSTPAEYCCKPAAHARTGTSDGTRSRGSHSPARPRAATDPNRTLTGCRADRSVRGTRNVYRKCMRSAYCAANRSDPPRCAVSGQPSRGQSATSRRLRHGHRCGPAPVSTPLALAHIEFAAHLRTQDRQLPPSEGRLPWPTGPPDRKSERLHAPLVLPGRCTPYVRAHCYASTDSDTP